MPRIALYPGSFDPVTDGHLDVVRHAVGLCDRLVVAIGVNSSKKPMFSIDERLEMVEEVFSPVAAAGGRGPPQGQIQGLEHDPEKWVPVFRKDHAQTKS